MKLFDMNIEAEEREPTKGQYQDYLEEGVDFHLHQEGLLEAQTLAFDILWDDQGRPQSAIIAVDGKAQLLVTVMEWTLNEEGFPTFLVEVSNSA